MKNFYNTRLLLLICLVLSFGFITSCDDDDDVDPTSGDVQLLSFGPTGVRHGDEIRFFGRNMDRVEAIELAGATVTKADFIEQTTDLIRLMVPNEAMAGLVTLRLADGGEVVSKTILSFNVPITITSVTEEARPGANITITGTRLNWVEGVVFDSDTVDEFVSQTASELVLQVPMTAKTGTLFLLGGGTEPMSIETENELVVTLPQVTALPTTPFNTGSNVTITGTNLDLVKAIMFTGVGEAVVTEFVSQTPTQIVAQIPANAATGPLTLVAMSDVEVETTQYLIVVLPAVTALSPNAVRHGQNLTITGTNLNLVEEIQFTGVGEANVSEFVDQSATQIVVEVPGNASTGTLTMVASSGVEVETTQQVNIVLPVITSLSPSPVDPGQNLTINGTNLDLVESIEFQGGTEVTSFVSQSATRIVVQVPMNAKRGALTLTTTSGYVIETDNRVSIILPAITTVTPEPVVPGNYLTISGTNLDLVQTVEFTGGARVSTFVAKNANQIVLTVPADAETGILKLITTTGFEVTTDKRAVIGTAAPNIDYYIYQEALATGWAKWNGWSTASQDMANKEQPHRGENAIKVVYDGYGALQFANTNANVLSGRTHLILYVYGDSGNTRIAIQGKNAAGANLNEVPVNVVGGRYTTIEIPLTALGNPANGISELWIKNIDPKADNTVYIDDIGLR
ncbi:IPT/TIG domain-containing protein [Pontibacter pamirensis]|uniref:IPT/TIG domain-containing protein n=1 Tax=Pontibacter pamirensis TaxID=2562824 RepID=UPI00138A0FB5|nr:IPT/TIG domain-containing protein [Pontibacter pamirensis]